MASGSEIVNDGRSRVVVYGFDADGRERLVADLTCGALSMALFDVHDNVSDGDVAQAVHCGGSADVRVFAGMLASQAAYLLRGAPEEARALLASEIVSRVGAMADAVTGEGE